MLLLGTLFYAKSGHIRNKARTRKLLGKLTKREKLLNKMRQIIYSLHRAKEITQTVYDTI